MATIKKYHVNPINIAPFVDILLVIFVILVIVARFGDSELEAFEQAKRDNEQLLEKIRNFEKLSVASSQNLKTTNNAQEDLVANNEELSRKNSELRRLLEKEKILLKDVQKNLSQKNIEIEKQTEKMKSSGVYIQIDSLGKIWLINPVNMKKNMQISPIMYQNIFKSLAGSSMIYYYDSTSQKSVETLNQIQSK